VALEALSSLWLGAPVGDDLRDTLLWTLGLLSLLALPLLAGYSRSAGR
jgi:hypothetical protein